MGDTPTREEQLLILKDGLLAQQTVYGAYRHFGKLVAAEIACQQEYFDHHVEAEATAGTEQGGADYAAERARLQIVQLQRLTAENARLFERHARDYSHWQLHNPAARAAPPDTMTTTGRGARCATCTERHSMVRLPCRMGAGVRSAVSFDSGTASPPRSEARLREAAGIQPQFRQGLTEFESMARETIQRTGALVRTRPMDYVGGAREAPWRHTPSDPSPAARPEATQSRVLESPVRAPSRTVRIQTPAPNEAPERQAGPDMDGRPAWPGMAGRPRPGEPGWPGPRPDYVPRPMSEQELARERLAALTEPTRATAATTRERQGNSRTTGLPQATAREIPRPPVTPCQSPVFATAADGGYLLPLAEARQASQRGEMQDLLAFIAQRHDALRNTGGPWPQAEVMQSELQKRVQAIGAQAARTARRLPASRTTVPDRW